MSGITNAGQFILDCAEILMYACTIAAPINGFLSGVILMQYVQFIWGPLSTSSPLRVRALATLATLSTFVDLWLTSANLNRNAVEVVRTPQRVLKVPVLFPEEVACTLVSIICVQLYFTEIVYKVLGRSRAWLCVAVLLLGTSLAGGIGTIWSFATVGVVLVRPHQSLYGNLRLALHGIWLCASAAFDIIVSVILCFHFLSSLRKSTVKNTKDVLTYLLVGTLETFILTAASAIIGVLLIFVPLQYSGLVIIQFNAGSIAFTVFLGRIYTMSLLYSVNRRAYVQQQMGRPMNTTVFPSTLSSGTGTDTNGNKGTIGSGAPPRRSLAKKLRLRTEVMTMSGFGEEERGSHATSAGATPVDTLDIKERRDAASFEKDSPCR